MGGLFVVGLYLGRTFCREDFLVYTLAGDYREYTVCQHSSLYFDFYCFEAASANHVTPYLILEALFI